jgi:hypothetical protein
MTRKYTRHKALPVVKPEKKKPTTQERVQLIKEAAELGVPFREVLKRWNLEQNPKPVKKPRGVAKALLENEGKPLEDYIVHTPHPVFDNPPEKFDLGPEPHGGVYWVPKAEDDGPVYDESAIHPFTRAKIYSHFQRLRLDQNIETIVELHKDAIKDPEGFKFMYGEELTKLIIQL